MLKKPLFCSIFILLFIGLSDYGYGHHHPDHDKGGGGGGGGPGGGGDDVDSCNFSEATVSFGDDVGTGGDPCDGTDGDKVCSDGIGDYMGGVDRVLTGGSKGFRFATRKLEGPRVVRELCLDFPNSFVDPDGKPPFTGPPIATFCQGFDMRIWGQDPDRTRLCEMGIDGQEDVPPFYELGMSIRFEVPGAIDNSMSLFYGMDPKTFKDPDNFDPLCGDKVQVRRMTSESWVFTSQPGDNACLTEQFPAGATVIDDSNPDKLLHMPFMMTITGVDVGP